MFRVNDVVLYLSQYSGVVSRVTDDGYLIVTMDEHDDFGGDDRQRVFCPDGTPPSANIGGVTRGCPGSRLELVRRPFQFGDPATYFTGDDAASYPGTIISVGPDYVVWRADHDDVFTRVFTLDGAGGAGYHESGHYWGDNEENRLRPSGEETPCEFEVGDEVLYIRIDYDREYLGKVTRIDRYVFVKLEPNDDIPCSREYLFKRDGTGTGGAGVDPVLSAMRTSSGTKIEKAPPLPEWHPKPGIEYPPAPTIGYGVFDDHYRPITPGHSCSTHVGYGILNLSENAVGRVAQEADDPSLLTIFEQAKREHQSDCLVKEFDAVENPFELLVGIEINLGWSYADEIAFEFQLPREIDRARQRHTLMFSYPGVCVATGLLTQDELNDKLRHHSRGLKVSAVEGEKITLSDGTEFYLHPRHRENYKPLVRADRTLKAKLAHNLALQRATRDSELALAA